MYKIFCSHLFEKELEELYKYVTIDLKSLVAWKSIKMHIYFALPDDDSPQRYQGSRNTRMTSIRRMTSDKYTIFYQINYDNKEIYLLHLLYRTN